MARFEGYKGFEWGWWVIYMLMAEEICKNPNAHKKFIHMFMDVSVGKIGDFDSKNGSFKTRI